MIGFVNVVGVILVEANGGGRCEPRDETPVDVVRLFRISRARGRQRCKRDLLEGGDPQASQHLVTSRRALVYCRMPCSQESCMVMQEQRSCPACDDANITQSIVGIMYARNEDPVKGIS